MINYRKNKGVTLIALIITIIVLLILAGVALSMIMGDSGIFGKANSASIQTKKTQYIEDLRILILEEKTKYTMGEKNSNRKIARVTNRGDEEENPKTFTNILYKSIPEKLDWVSKIEVESVDDSSSQYDNVLVVTSKDNYEILVDVADESIYAVIEGNSFNTVQKPCKVKFDNNGGTGKIDDKEVRKGFKVELPACTFDKQYHEFAGWSLESNGSSVTYSSGEKIKIEEDTKFYAIWTRTSVKITYDANGGEGAPEEQIKETETDIQLREEEPTRSGYKFMGWATSSTATEKEYSPKDTYTGNTELNLYAVWRAGYSIKYNANGGTNVPQEQIKYTGTTLKLSELTVTTVPKKANNLFIGWSKSNTATTASYLPGATFTEELTGDLTLYAVYRSYNFTYTGGVQSVTLYPGTYQLQVWGAQGGTDYNGNYGGHGAYAVGTMNISSITTLYVFVGGQGVKASSASIDQSYNSLSAGGYNGGGAGGGSNGPGGGGATDIRTVNGTWNNSTSLNSRIIVAGGGGGDSANNANSAARGNVSGSTYSLGVGANGATGTCGNYKYDTGGGGGGYYGGAAVTSDDSRYAYGGTSYVNTSSLTSTSITAGNSSFVAPGGGTETGHTGNGYARITRTN